MFYNWCLFTYIVNDGMLSVLQLSDMKGWTVTGSGDETIQEARSTIRLSTSQNVLDDANLYWVAPATYLGRKVCVNILSLLCSHN